MKDTDHLASHPRVHLGDRASAATREVYLQKKDGFGRGQDTVLGWSDPGFWPHSVANPARGVAPAQRRFVTVVCPRMYWIPIEAGQEES
ncbi:MAG TPA: hypothetical protein VJN89_01985 [Candidatus Acidoferrum sp.]|nr:hypothetical protein [Candidatus Acidoferrum sp.]